MTYGFVIIFFAWLWQWYRYGWGHQHLEPWFLRLSAIGFLVIILDTFKFGNWLTWVNLLTLIVIILLVLKVRR